MNSTNHPMLNHLSESQTDLMSGNQTDLTWRLPLACLLASQTCQLSKLPRFIYRNFGCKYSPPSMRERCPRTPAPRRRALGTRAPGPGRDSVTILVTLVTAFRLAWGRGWEWGGGQGVKLGLGNARPKWGDILVEIKHTERIYPPLNQ